MGRDRAAYMREYRAKRKRDAETIDTLGTYAGPQVIANRDHWDADRVLVAENAALTAEVARLKRELAARPVGDPEQDARIRKALSYPTRPFTEFRPVPKPSQRK